MRVTPATSADLDGVVDLWVELAADQRRHGSHVRPEPSRGAVRETIGRQIVAGNAYVAREDDTIVGFVTASIDQGAYDHDVTRGVVNALYVRPAYRDDHVGSELLEAAEEGLIAAGADVLALEAMAANADARRFYRAHGYEPHRVELEKPVEDSEDEARNGHSDGGRDGDDSP